MDTAIHHWQSQWHTERNGNLFFDKFSVANPCFLPGTAGALAKMKNIAKKKALITGAAAGIGKAIASALAREGAELYLLDIDEPRLTGLADSLRQQGAQVIVRRCDLTDRAELDVCLEELLATWGGVDIVVNNAGLAYYGPTDSMSDQQWDTILGVNLLAPAQIIRRLLPSLKARGEARIVNIASIAGLLGVKRGSAYSLTKFGIVGFSESLRSELVKFGIGVITVCPGFVRTNLFSSAMTAQESKGPPEPFRLVSVTPEFVAEQVIKSIRKNRRLVVVTALARMLWRIQRLWPGLLVAALGGFRRKPRLVVSNDIQSQPRSSNSSARKAA